MGLDNRDEAVTRRGWAILEKIQAKIYNLVMDMLSYSKDREPALEPADLNEVVQDVIELMQSRAEELNVELRWVPGEEIPQVLLDPDGIHRAVLNLVTNAIDAVEKVGGGGEVEVSTEWTEELARIRVKDNGPGIPAEEIPSIFAIFTSSKGTRGTGLGLPVSQKIVREHGGRIVVESAPGAGTRFLIELPQKRFEETGHDGPSGLAGIPD
jgi:signal transduction histidine kinase